MIKIFISILIVYLLQLNIVFSQPLISDDNFKLSEITTQLSEPWGMTFIDDDNLLVTEKTGEIIRIDIKTGEKYSIDHELDFFYYGQGGLLDILYDDGYVYVSYSEDREQGKSSTSICIKSLVLPERLCCLIAARSS